METAAPKLERTLTLSGAVRLNLLDMIGVGPFITLPLLLGAMGGPQAMLGWILGALLAVCDGLVWAELGAAMPEAGGTYHYLGEMFRGRLGRLLSFLFLFQLCFSAPLSVASGCIGLSQYATYLVPQLAVPPVTHTLRLAGYSAVFSIGPTTFVAIAAVVLAVILLYRNLAKVRVLSIVLLSAVLVTIAWAVVVGLMHGHIAQVFAFSPHAFVLNRAFFGGLGSAMLIATYDYWGYYNVTFLGGEVRDPGRTIPRAVLLSIGIVALLYLALNASVLSVIGAPQLLAAQNLEARRALLSQFMQVAYAPSLGAHVATLLGKLAALLVMVTAFASVFSLLLGYSRIPYAAARDGNFLAAFGRLHPTRRFPHVSLLVLGAIACVCCFFSLADVIAALVVLRILLQFVLQHIGVMLLRLRRPEMPRPFRLWLYPLPPLLALMGFGYIVVSRPNFHREVLLAVVVAIAGCLVFAVRSAMGRPGSGARI
ncbi:APC family permease [Granulicella mallensis]|uniref:Amino acid transporter n=1 Tax=Granulicella mallensis TaxID=940614 RepID=A0A7W7ZQY0_9BACT|nr:APC family permease [Granulicella mallensis]MBB5064169.1 amino acid transporter [Granulicella mallensis]